MSKFMSLIRRAPKRVAAVVLVIAAAIIVPAATLAWGPDRPTYTVEQPAPHITFNSITNNPNYGDERNFVTIKDAADTGIGNWKDEISVQNNKEYLVRMYVHNNAAENLNLVAENVTARFSVPDYSAKSLQVNGFLSSSNATPGTVFDQAIFKSDANFSLQYVTGSALYMNNLHTNGVPRSDAVISTGVQLGYQEMDGKIPGCFKYSGIVTFKVKAVTSDFEVQKTVRKNGIEDKSFKESVDVKAGDKVDFQIKFKNTGGTNLSDVVIKDTLPAGLTYVSGSTQLSNGGGTRTVADGITTNGLNIGNYAPGGAAYLLFTAQVTTQDKLPVCGPNTLKNVAKATTSVGTKEDDAKVIVPKECQPGQITVCELATNKIITINENQFDSKKHSKNLADCDVKKITVCELKTNTIISIKDAEFEAKLHSKNVDDCKLPTTGPAENIVAFLGLGALIASIAYYVASRRALNQ